MNAKPDIKNVFVLNIIWVFKNNQNFIKAWSFELKSFAWQSLSRMHPINWDDFSNLIFCRYEIKPDFFTSIRERKLSFKNNKSTCPTPFFRRKLGETNTCFAFLYRINDAFSSSKLFKNTLKCGSMDRAVTYFTYSP